MKRIVIVVCVIIGLNSCYDDKYDKLYPKPSSTSCDSTTMSYKNDIAPIIAASCAVNGGCHNASGNPTTGNLDFTIFTTVQSQATADLMINDIVGTPSRGHNAMPLNLPKLSSCDINKITWWIDQGALNN